jgi:THO complex subunit 1
MAGYVVQAVDGFGELLKELLQRADETKKTTTVEPPLDKTALEDILERVEATLFPSAETLELRKQRHPAVETAIRDKFNDLLVGWVIFDIWTFHLMINRLLR